jgi:hypothetical protein
MKNSVRALMALLLLVQIVCGFWEIGSPIASSVTATLSSCQEVLTISGEGDMMDWDMGFTSMSPWFYTYRNTITSVVIDSGVTKLGDRVFWGSTSLARVDFLGRQTISIGDDIFGNYAMIGNVVHDSPELTWDLRNTAGRYVVNGTYLVVVETKDKNGRTKKYSEKLGVKR